MGILSSIGKVAAKVLDTTTIAIAHPVKTIGAIISPKTSVSQVIEEHFKQPLGVQLLQTGIGTATIAGAVSLGATAALGSAAGKGAAVGTKIIMAGAKTAIANPVKTAAVAGTAAVTVPLIIESPKAASEIISSPTKLAGVGADLAKVVENPTLSNAKEFVTEHPIATAVAAAGTALLATKVVQTATTALQVAATKEQTKAIMESTESLKSQGVLLSNEGKSAITTGEGSFTKPLLSSPVPSTETNGKAEVITPTTMPILEKDKSQTRKRRRTYRQIQPVRVYNKVEVRNNMLFQNRKINKLLYA